jgi:hypothetical protein
MIGKICVGLITAAMVGTGAQAANCGAYMYTLTNGTVADANQVMSNFNNILSCANSNLAPLAGPHFTGNVGIGNNSPVYQVDVIGEGNLPLRRPPHVALASP